MGGLTAKRASKLKVLNAPISAQVAAIMSDSERVRARCDPPVSRPALRVLGESPASAAAASSVAAASELRSAAAAGGGGVSASTVDAEGAEGAAAAGGGHHQHQLYDDTDFFTALLKDFSLSSSSSSSSSSGGAFSSSSVIALLLGDGADGAPSSSSALSALSALTSSIRARPRGAGRAGVDRKASKSRKLKFVVHPKLVGFAAPAPYVVPPEMAFDLDTVVASVFRSVV